MARNRKRPDMPGDYHMDREAIAGGEQALTAEQKALLERGMSLFRFFYDRNREAHTEMREARRMRQLRQTEKSRTSPASTALQSSIDNVIADQMDNMPEAQLVPEREETARSAEEMPTVFRSRAA